jgi:hypothetical protein
MVVIILNTILMVLISLFPEKFGYFGVQIIAREEIVVLWGIMLAITGVVIGVNKYIEKITF